jgi:glycopeptide antibiotics resistance protein
VCIFGFSLLCCSRAYNKIVNLPVIDTMGMLRKIAVILPVVVISSIYAVLHQQQFQHAGHKRLAVLIFSLLLFYLWVMAGAIRRRQDSIFDMLVQASFYVFVFSVLTLTGYFIFFNQVTAHGWWHKLVMRVHSGDGINLKALDFMGRKNMLTYDVVGNFCMLFPLGFYLPLLYRRLNNFFLAVFTALLVSLCIELMQLATNFRISDINDVILNTAGAAAGFIVFWLINTLLVKPSQSSARRHMYN